MDNAAIHARKGLLVNGAPRDNGRGGHITAAKRLGQREDIGLEAPMFKGKPLAGATQAGLYLVADEERAVLAAERLRAVVVIVPGELDALALDQFDDERGDVALLQLKLKFRQVAHGDRFAAGNERTEALVESGIARHRKRAIAQAMVGILERKKPGPARGALCEL